MLNGNLLLRLYSSEHYLSGYFVSFRYTFASGSADNIKQWMFPDGNFIQNLSGHNAIINTLAVNSNGVLVSGGIYKPPTQLASRGLSVNHAFPPPPHSRQWNHPPVGLEDRIQLPAHSCSCAARFPGQRVGHLRLPV